MLQLTAVCYQLDGGTCRRRRCFHFPRWTIAQLGGPRPTPSARSPALGLRAMRRYPLLANSGLRTRKQLEDESSHLAKAAPVLETLGGRLGSALTSLFVCRDCMKAQSPDCPLKTSLHTSRPRHPWPGSGPGRGCLHGRPTAALLQLCPARESSCTSEEATSKPTHIRRPRLGFLGEQNCEVRSETVPELSQLGVPRDRLIGHVTARHGDC
ncbi:hypothetical protein B0H66DRAFT_540682 [Apodospora peruviana]|uniref:Uncharacterized protein n=1 Tax=Apodospora peruviana TaxID=516989 RepID=A0AAE0IQ55_9PEZI|nr:hypothetical protein B0H66DRAFT_540682 [Apodospora peruviana]